jgi:hypothetical protein
MAAILLKPHLGGCPELCRKHDAGHSVNPRVLHEASRKFSQPEFIGYLIIINPCKDPFSNSLNSSIPSPCESRPWLDYVVDRKGAGSQSRDHGLRTVGNRRVIDYEDREAWVGLADEARQAPLKTAGLLSRTHDNSKGETM